MPKLISLSLYQHVKVTETLSSPTLLTLQPGAGLPELTSLRNRDHLPALINISPRYVRTGDVAIAQDSLPQ